ncbi:MAG: hypothetical protein QNJ13_16475 [Paracoccaceae bacterium]|nr:hypothetical protein [Paracoccaceae bacterium]
MDFSSIGSMSSMFGSLPSQTDLQQTQTDRMNEVDTDGSGGISFDEAGETEFGGKIQDNFADIDTDGDGEITDTEMSDFMQSKMDEMMNSFSGFGGADSGSMFDALLEALDSGDDDGETSDSYTNNTQSAFDAYQELTALA